MASRRSLSFSTLGVALACAPSASQDDSPGSSAAAGATTGPNGTAGSGAEAGTNAAAGASGGTLGASGAPTYGGFATVGGWPAVGGMTSTGGRPAMNLPYSDDFEDAVLDSAWIRDDDGAPNYGASWPIVVDTTATTNHVLELGPSSYDTWEVGGNYTWTDYVFQVRVRLTDTSGYAYVAVRFSGVDSYYFLQMEPGSKPKIRARTTTGSSSSTNDVCAGTVNLPDTTGTWYTVTVAAQGSTISATIDGTLVCSGTNAAIPAGGIAIGSDSVQVFFDDVSVQ